MILCDQKLLAFTVAGVAFNVAFGLFGTCNCSSGDFVNNRPIIGILSQEYHSSDGNHVKDGIDGVTYSYIAASYVKYLESGGARVVPIHIDKPLSYYIDIFNKTNGILFPGGGSDLLKSGYAKSAKILWDLAIDANQRGDYYPLWGTCLGFELMTVLVR